MAIQHSARRRAWRTAGAAGALAIALASTAATLTWAQPAAPAAKAPAPVAGTEFTGILAGGARYVMFKPAAWNGVLVVEPDLPFGRRDVQGPGLHALGYATANRSRDATTWRIREGSSELVQLRSLFIDQFAKPKTTILIGGSLGGIVTRDAAETYPQVFDGVVPTCGGGAALIGMYNQRHDVGFALKTLLAPGADAIELNNIKDEKRSGAALKAEVDKALLSPQGRARVALAAAIGQLQGWATGAAGPPAADDYDAQLKAMGDSAGGILTLRSEVEKSAGGVFSWTVGVDYRAMFELATPAQKAMTRELYRRAGLSLDADLATLNAAPKLMADPAALAWARNNGTPTGKLKMPTFVLFTAVDPRAPRSEFRAYQKTVDRAGAQALLRQIGVYRSGHCAFVASERIAAIEVMNERIKTGRWPATGVAAMNARATAINAASGGVLGEPKFADFPDTPQYTRMFTADDVAPVGALKPIVNLPPATR